MISPTFTNTNEIECKWVLYQKVIKDVRSRKGKAVSSCTPKIYIV